MIQVSNNDTYNNGELQETTVQRRECEPGIKQTHSLGINGTSNRAAIYQRIKESTGRGLFYLTTLLIHKNLQL